MTHIKSFTEWRIVSAGGHESAKVSSVVKFSRLKVARQERSETMSSGKLFQTAGAACEKARSAKARLVGTCWLVISVAKPQLVKKRNIWLWNVTEFICMMCICQDVEREISFRTESGLYYSYYKQLVVSHSFYSGAKYICVFCSCLDFVLF